jgi:hypothetical protein
MTDRAEDEAIKRHEEIFGKPVHTLGPTRTIPCSWKWSRFTQTPTIKRWPVGA